MKVKIISIAQSENKSWFVELELFPWFGLFGSKRVAYRSDGPVTIFWYRLPDLTEITYSEPKISTILKHAVRRYRMQNE